MATQNCYVCGKEYDVCSTCEEARINPWRKTVCCAQHFQIRLAYLQYKDGDVTIEQAREMLKNIGVTEVTGLKPGYQDFFKQIFGTKQVIAEEPAVTSVFKKKRKSK